MRRPLLARRPTGADAARFFHHLRAPERTSTLRAVVDGVVVARTLRRHGARPLFASLGDHAGHPDPVRSIEVAAAVDAGLGLIPMEPTCLRRSVTLLRELRRLGLTATMHVGVRQGPAGVEAHVWVQVASVVINDDPAVKERYGELAAREVEGVATLLR